MTALDDSAFDMHIDEDSDEDFMSDGEENVAPPSKKGSMKTAPKASTVGKSKPNPILSPRNANIASVSVKQGEKRETKTIEERYQKKSQREHVLIRPDTYIGSVMPITEEMFVYDAGQDAIVKKEITYTPGLFKIFDEIIVNAADNKQRDPNMDKLEVEIDATANTISVKNNGDGIPIEMHKEHKCYVPTLIFGELLTGSNFDDKEARTTGGRNGYGAKLANIFSTEFIVECCDIKRGLKFKQVFADNMSTRGEAIVKNCSAAEKKKGDWTKITFSPDLARFNMKNLDDDTVGLLSRRAYDIAGTMANGRGKKLSVSLNGKKIPVNSFKDYIQLHQGINPPEAFERIDDRWEVGVSHSGIEGSPMQISFVNAIATSKGGNHVTYVADKIVNHLMKTIEKKNKGGAKITKQQVKNHLCIFVNCLVDNPTFDSQTKDNLTTRPKQFKDNKECELSEKFLKQVSKSSIVENVLAFAKYKQSRELKKVGGVKKIKLTGIAKLDDANKAGSAQSSKCTLIITEGDSAKSLAMSGLSVVGRDYYGVYPLKGKPLNVRDATHNQVMANAEVKAIMDILGLKPGVKYTEENIKTLRYGSLMIMADQDHDGSHIKGLVINFIHHFWPSLLDVPGFLKQFITPIVKVTKGKQSKTFFTLPEYESWKESTGNDGKGWKIKYYKGLGTSTASEAKEYFGDLDTHEITFDRLSHDIKVESRENNEDELDFNPEKATSDAMPDRVNSYGGELIDLVFNKRKAEERRTWMTENLAKDIYLDYAVVKQQGSVKYSDFINKEFILFSRSDCDRSIPHVMDGFKPSQRKVLYACIKRKLKDEIKVAQLAGYIGEHSAYHHGEASLHSTIVGMAQQFVGSNNINLLTPSGQFGTRRMGGKDSASPRYIFTMLENITRKIFHPDDDELLNYLSDDGLSIEPDFYMPVIPMILVNGSDGIGTGWSSKIPNYDPRMIITNIRKLMAGEPMVEMQPFYSGFNGEISPDGPGKYQVKGIIERIDATTLEVTELPVRTWTQDFKAMLDTMLVPTGKETSAEIRDFQEFHTDTTVKFVINADEAKIDQWEKIPKGGLYAKFKLISSISTTNMHAFDTDHQIAKYSTPEAILQSFFDLRMEYYHKRKNLMVKKLRRQQAILSNKARFVEEVCSGELVVSSRKKAELLEDLQSRGFGLFDDMKDLSSPSDTEEGSEVEEEETSLSDLAKGYEYLLGMKIWSLTFEKAEELRSQLAERTKELKELENTAPSTIWSKDLDAIEEALDVRDLDIAEAEQDEKKAQKKTAKRQATKQKKADDAAAAKKRNTKKADGWISEDEDGSEDNTTFNDVDINKPTAAACHKPTTKAPVMKAATLKKAVALTKPPIKVAAKSAPKEAKAPARATVPKLAPTESENDDDIMEISLMDRLKKKSNVTSKVASSSDSSKRPSPKYSEETSAKRAKVTKKKADSRSKKKSIESDDEEEFDFADSDSEIGIDVPPPAVAANRSRRAARPTAKKSYVDESFLASDDDGSDSDF
ncbi:DNA topoisomerase [Nitzschia inconspicua]|uniref:DNA topoisomerase 2 n=1 Tax=Nitzschia inconspicua TaxID=303405 RepID=A0A9K3PYV4_9STRA|nr:DNA topoisomerase [Nitzschia inconspicua]